MTILLDTGALIAVDRGRRAMLSRLQTALENGDRIRAPAGVIGLVWRDGGCQTLLSGALNRYEEVPLDGRTARSAGQLCGQTGTHVPCRKFVSRNAGCAPVARWGPENVETARPRISSRGSHTRRCLDRGCFHLPADQVDQGAETKGRWYTEVGTKWLRKKIRPWVARLGE